MFDSSARNVCWFIFLVTKSANMAAIILILVKVTLLTYIDSTTIYGDIILKPLGTGCFICSMTPLIALTRYNR